MPTLYDTFDYSPGFIAVNTISTLFVVTNLIPLQNLPGKKGSKDAQKVFCEGHYNIWGPFLGVREGDQCDGRTCMLMIPLTLCCWFPIALCQCYTAMAATYWSFNIIGVLGSVHQSITSDDGMDSGDNMAGLMIVFAFVPLLNAIYRVGYYTMPHVPGDGSAFAAMFGVWYFISMVHCTITNQRCYRLMEDPTQKFMVDQWTAHDAHMKKDKGAKWPNEQINPDGYDPLTMGPTNVLAQLRKRTGKELKTEEEIEAHIEEYLDKNTAPKSVWMMRLVIFFTLLFVLPPAIGAIVV